MYKPAFKMSLKVQEFIKYMYLKCFEDVDDIISSLKLNRPCYKEKL